MLEYGIKTRYVLVFVSLTDTKSFWLSVINQGGCLPIQIYRWVLGHEGKFQLMGTNFRFPLSPSSAACAALDPGCAAPERPVQPGMKPSTNPDETLLIRAAVNGNLDAFNQIILAYQELAYNHALALMGDPDPAADVTQESLIKAYHKIGQFQGGSFRAWLLSIVTHTAYDHLRRTVRHPTVALIPEDDDGEEIESASWLVDTAPSVQSAVEDRETSLAIRRALDQLPEVFRSILILVDVYEMDYQEAARSLNIPVGTVRSRLARARLRLRELLTENNDNPRDNPEWIQQQRT